MYGSYIIQNLSLEEALSKSSYDDLNHVKQFLIDNYSNNDKTEIYLYSDKNENIFVIEYNLNIDFQGKDYKIFVLVYLPSLFPNVQPDFYLEKGADVGVNCYYKGKINFDDLKINIDYFGKFDYNKNNIKEIIDNLVSNFNSHFPIWRENNNQNWKNSGKCVLIKYKIRKVILPKNKMNLFSNDINYIPKSVNMNANNDNNILLEEYKDKINKLYERINGLNEKIDDLNEKLGRYPFVLEKNEKLISIIISSTNQQIHYSLICKNTNTINDIEKDIYKEFPDYSERENIFLCKGKIINKFETFESNHIKNGDILILEQRDD